MTAAMNARVKTVDIDVPECCVCLETDWKRIRLSSLVPCRHFICRGCLTSLQHQATKSDRPLLCPLDRTYLDCEEAVRFAGDGWTESHGWKGNPFLWPPIDARLLYPVFSTGRSWKLTEEIQRTVHPIRRIEPLSLATCSFNSIDQRRVVTVVYGQSGSPWKRLFFYDQHDTQSKVHDLRTVLSAQLGLPVCKLFLWQCLRFPARQAILLEDDAFIFQLAPSRCQLRIDNDD